MKIEIKNKIELLEKDIELLNKEGDKVNDKRNELGHKNYDLHRNEFNELEKQDKLILEEYNKLFDNNGLIKGKELEKEVIGGKHEDIDKQCEALNKSCYDKEVEKQFDNLNSKISKLKEEKSKLYGSEIIGNMTIKEGNKHTLRVVLEEYGRYGYGGDIRKLNIKCINLKDGLIKLCNNCNISMDEETINEEKLEDGQILDSIDYNNGDGYDYIINMEYDGNSLIEGENEFEEEDIE